jgi:hypothetical protein
MISDVDLLRYLCTGSITGGKPERPLTSQELKDLALTVQGWFRDQFDILADIRLLSPTGIVVTVWPTIPECPGPFSGEDGSY